MILCRHSIRQKQLKKAFKRNNKKNNNIHNKNKISHNNTKKIYLKDWISNIRSYLVVKFFSIYKYMFVFYNVYII